MSCGVAHRCGLDSALLCLWRRLAATALASTPSLGTSICYGCGPKKTKNENKNKNCAKTLDIVGKNSPKCNVC